MKGVAFPQAGIFLVELLLDNQWVADTTRQQQNPRHQSDTFGSGQTQFFECEAFTVDHPEIQARERARQQRLQLANPTDKQARLAPDGEAGKSTRPD